MGSTAWTWWQIHLVLTMKQTLENDSAWEVEIICMVVYQNTALGSISVPAFGWYIGGTWVVYLRLLSGGIWSWSATAAVRFLITGSTSARRKGCLSRLTNLSQTKDRYSWKTVQGGRGDANAVIKCKLCSRENSIDILPETIVRWIQGSSLKKLWCVLLSYDMKDNNKAKTIVVFDCRGLEPVDFSPRMGWKVRKHCSN